MSWKPTTWMIWTIVLAGSATALAAGPRKAPSAAVEVALERHEPAAQDPCQTQLVADLMQCEATFSGFFQKPLLNECIAGARRANIACLGPKQPKN